MSWSLMAHEYGVLRIAPIVAHNKVWLAPNTTLTGRAAFVPAATATPEVGFMYFPQQVSIDPHLSPTINLFTW
jgi:hypothetical protein